jgi:hypothetical protein
MVGRVASEIEKQASEIQASKMVRKKNILKNGKNNNNK